MLKKYFELPESKDLGLLITRVSIGLMMAFAHGLGKLERLFAEGPVQFSDPLGIGAEFSLFLAAGTEFFLALMLVLGFLTRLVSIPLAFTMIVAAFVVHLDDPFRKQEFALLYLFPFVMFIFTGPGKYSIDSMIRRKL